MAAETPQDDILPTAKLKQLLGLAEKEPLSCALGLTKDKKHALLLIDKIAKPKKVKSQLEKDAKDVIDKGTVRFGRVSIDAKNDSGTVRFDVNLKEAGGTITGMIRLLRLAQYSGCVFNEITSLDNEPEEDAPASAAPAPQPTAPAAAAPPPPPPPPPPSQQPIDASALKARLTALVQRIPAALAVDPSRKEALLGLAKQAQLMLGTNNLKTATQHIDDLEKALGDTPSGGTTSPTPETGAPKPGAAVTYAKSRLAWIAARQKVSAEIAKLRAQLLTEYKEDPRSVEILDAYDTRAGNVLGGFDEKLADKLDEATNAEDAALRTKLVAEAKALIATYQQFLDGEKLIADFDENPFVPLTIRATMGATLTALSAAIH
jgi:hypothetical protein